MHVGATLMYLQHKHRLTHTQVAQSLAQHENGQEANAREPASLSRGQCTDLTMHRTSVLLRSPSTRRQS